MDILQGGSQLHAERARGNSCVVWGQAHGFTRATAATSAQYDPPFAFPWLRRNEILLAR